MVPLGSFLTLDQHCRCDITEDEMTVPVAPFQMRRANLGIDHERLGDRTGAHHIRRRLDAERGRGTGDVHIKAETAGA